MPDIELKPSLMTSLSEIYSYLPCTRGWEKVLQVCGKKEPDSVQFPISSLVDRHPTKDIFWLLHRRHSAMGITSCGPEREVERQFAEYYVQAVEHLVGKTEEWEYVTRITKEPARWHAIEATRHGRRIYYSTAASAEDVFRYARAALCYEAIMELPYPVPSLHDGGEFNDIQGKTWCKKYRHLTRQSKRILKKLLDV